MKKYSNNTLSLGLGLGLGVLALPGTAFAQAWSHLSMKSISKEAAPGNGTANAGFVISGEAQEGAGAQAGGGRSIQSNTIWAKIRSSTYTVSSLRGLANAHAVWGVSQDTNTSLTATLFGQTVLNNTKACAQTCESKSSFETTHNISPAMVIWSDPSGLAKVTGQLTGTMGYNFVAQASSKPLGGFADMSSLASNGANGSVGLAIRGIVGFDFINVGVGAILDVAKLSVSASVHDAMRVNSRTDLDLSWSNKAPLTFSSGGGKVVAGFCIPLLGCPGKTLFSWPGFSQTGNGYSDTGSLSNVSF